MIARALVLSLVVPGCLGAAPETDVRRAPVVGGRPAGAGELYSTVAIVTTADGATICTGTLIAPTVVLTAAHCLVYQDEVDWETVTPMGADEIAVSVGLLDATSPTPTSLYSAVMVAAHEGYPGEIAWSDPDALGREEDVGVIVLATAIVELPPAPLLAMPRVDSILSPGAEVIIEGYGVTNLRADDGSSVLNIASTEFQRRSGHEMIAGRNGMPDTCYGDSGGPAYVWDGDVLALAGVTSRAAGSSPLECGGGGIYTLAPAYDEWIRDVTGGAYPPPVAPPPEPEVDPEPDDSPPPDAPDLPDETGGDPASPEESPGEMAYYYGGCSAAAGAASPALTRLLAALL